MVEKGTDDAEASPEAVLADSRYWNDEVPDEAKACRTEAYIATGWQPHGKTGENAAPQTSSKTATALAALSNITARTAVRTRCSGPEPRGYSEEEKDWVS